MTKLSAGVCGEFDRGMGSSCIELEHSMLNYAESNPLCVPPYIPTICQVGVGNSDLTATPSAAVPIVAKHFGSSGCKFPDRRGRVIQSVRLVFLRIIQ